MLQIAQGIKDIIKDILGRDIPLIVDEHKKYIKIDIVEQYIRIHSSIKVHLMGDLRYKIEYHGEDGIELAYVRKTISELYADIIYLLEEWSNAYSSD